MARREIKSYEVTDDLTGEIIPEDEAQEIRFSYGGTDYEIDLGKESVKALDDFLAPYIDAARSVKKTAKRGLPTAPGEPKQNAGYSSKDVREHWKAVAGKNGIPDFNAGGRIPSVVYASFNRENPPK